MNIETGSEHSENGKTFFASAKRSSSAELREQLKRLVNDPVVKIILEAVKGYTLILNENRQILAGNSEILQALNLKENEIVGSRPGELMNCVHCNSAPSGCGTGYNCQSCGAVLSILSSLQKNKIANDECRLMISKNGNIECIDFQVRVTPFCSGSSRMLVLVLQDVSNSKRKDVLERIFFHDINNTLGALSGYCSLFKHKNEIQLAGQILKIADRLRDEIGFQEFLLSAEKGTLAVKIAPAKLSEILDKLKAVFAQHKAAEDKNISYQPLLEEVWFNTDIVLLHKILVNMIKNALEATATGGTIKFYYELFGNTIKFCVQNQGVIPTHVALNIFHRSFSTKGGSGRGVGTYSMKLFGENYLKGQVGFSSDADSGTIFYIELPGTVV